MRAMRSRSVLLDVYGAFVRDLGGWIAVADLVRLLAAVGVEEQAVRLAVSRFSRNGLLARRKVQGRVGYELTGRAGQLLAEGDQRIYSILQPARLDEGWALASFSVPEEIRELRHQLRSRLAWLGFGSLGGGLWIAPARVMHQARELVEQLGLEAYVDLFRAHYEAFADTSSLVARCWDVDRMRAAYRAYIDEFGPVLDAHRGSDPQQDPARAFADFVAGLHEWRKLPYVDPGLPTELLPEDWEGTEAATLFQRLREVLEPVARRHVESELTVRVTVDTSVGSPAGRSRERCT
jgi:phenylacetic acid degradation operon negative regulatory protein